MFTDVEVARLCWQSYWELYEIEGRFDEKGVISKDDVEVFWLLSGNELLFVFRGTELKFSDIFRNIPFGNRTKYKIHGGYYYAFYSVWDEIKEVICEFHDKKILFAGHSAGGAIAMTASIFMNPDRLVTFGQPRTSSSKANERIKDIEYRRYVNKADFCPWFLFAARYKHFGEERFLTPNMTRKKPGKWIKLIIRLLSWPQLFVNHRAIEYFEIMRSQKR